MALPVDPLVLATWIAQLTTINNRLASGAKEIRYKNRSTTFDLGVLQNERLRLESLIASASTIQRPMTRRLLTFTPSKGL